MKLKNYAVVSIALMTLSPAQALPLRGKSFFSPRSQSANAARNFAGLELFTYDPARCTSWGFWSATVNYSHTFSTKSVAEYFFGYDTLRFSGSQVPQRDDNDILADYFGLSTTFNGSVTLRPHWHSALVDLRLYAGLDGIARGLYATVYAPAAWTRSYIRLDEVVGDDGVSTPYPIQYMSDQQLNAPLRTINEAWNRTTLYGDVQEPLTYGKIAGAQSQRGIADIHAELGWNFILCDHGHVGLRAHLGIPTGNRSTAEFLFEPMIGNGHHWELGVGASGHVRVWEKDGEQELAVYLDALLTHLCSSRQRRSFDFLKNGFGSRYLLLKEFNTIGAYTRRLVPAINKTTLACDVWYPLQLEFLFMFGYHYNSFSLDFGYNGWLRSRERIKLKGKIAHNKYGIKGIQNVTLPAGAPSSATQSIATLHGNDFADQALLVDATSPLFVNTGDLNVKSAAATSALTHKLFAHVSYVLPTTWYAEPFVGMGTEIEFEGILPRDSEPNKPTMSQVSLWIKGGFVF